MGKKSDREVEPLFTPIKTTDDDDDDDVELARDGGPAPRYRDDPQAQASISSDDGGPATSYRDDPGSIFDWGDSGSNSGVGDTKRDTKNATSNRDDDNEDAHDGSPYQIDEFDADANGFSPISLHDSDDSDDEEQNGIDFDGNGRTPNDKKIRRKANKLLERRIFDDTTYDDTDERIFVGGGWGRHGSQFSLCSRARGWLSCSCCKTKPKYSYGPPKMNSNGYSTCQLVCWTIAFFALVIGSGYVGFEAGLPVEDDNVEDNNSDGENKNTTSGIIVHHTHTKGEQWLQWLEHEKDDFHMPKFNWTAFHKKNHPKLNDEETNEAFKSSFFDPMTQSQLLKLSENIFQSCSERSLKTVTGRLACLSQCHGHYCCFERDVKFGSCVAETNSYCFAYAACENAIVDFEMNNANTPPSSSLVTDAVQGEHNLLNTQDVKLLSETCSEKNVATLAGIRDCTAFCEHHLCCFNELESESCRNEQPETCRVYDACRILVDGPKDVNVGGVMMGSGGGGGDLAAAIVAARNNDGGGSSGSGSSNNNSNNDNNGDSSAVANPQPVVEHTFKKDCLQSNLHDNWDICKNHCSRYECCFREVDSCYERNSLECDEYYICEEFYLDESDHFVASGGYSSNQGNNGPGSDESGAYDHYDMDENKDISIAVHAVCGLEDAHPGDDSWVTACHALCADHLCCFTSEGSQSNCRSQKGEAACNAYQGCVVLMDKEVDNGSNNISGAGSSSSSGVTPSSSTSSLSEEQKKQQEIDEVLVACTAKARRDPWLADRCRKACASRSCCFEGGPGGCSSDYANDNWCDEFRACDVLYT